MVSASDDSSESQLFAMALLINAKLEHQTFASIIATLISNPSSKGKPSTQSVTLTKDWVEIW